MESTDRWAETTARKRRDWLLFFLFIIGLGMRLHGYDWGFPHHFHPDERQIVDFQTPKVRLDILNPQKSVTALAKGDWDKLSSMVDAMNTKFFAYGPLPMYTLAVTVEITDTVNRSLNKWAGKSDFLPDSVKRTIREKFPRVKTGKGRIVTGRIIAAFLSALTILAVFKLGRYLYNRKVACLAAAFFTFTVLSIQQAHFMIVDGPQTFLVAWAMYFLVRVAMGDRRRDYYLAALFIGLGMATKFSTAPIGLAYIIAHFLSMTKGRRRGRSNWVHWILGGLTAVAVMSIVMPFWIIDSKEFFHDIKEQQGMVQGIANLPYTIQFEHTTPFIYMIKNMILWSMGLPLGLVSFIGLGAAIRRIWKKPTDLGNIVIISFVLPLLYFNGTFFAKFLRYTLVLMPFMVLFAARWLYGMKTWAGRNWSRTMTLVVVLGTIGWALAFQTIFLEPHTRLQASDWIYENVEEGANIVQESGWDDALPVTTDKGNVTPYNTRQLGIYKEPDNERRAAAMAEVLEWGDVVILSSRKHYGSVSRVPNRYPVSTNFYKLLFQEALGYRHVKSFTNPPALGILKFDDELADESFNVYEHPKVDIFVKETLLSTDYLTSIMMAPPHEYDDLTYEELLTRKPSTEIGSKVPFPIFKWLLAIEIMGLIFFPMAFIVFKKFDHKGYPFTKIVALLVLGYTCWIIPSLKLQPFSQTLIFMSIILFSFINYLLYQQNKDDIDGYFKERWWGVAGYELLFLGVFALFALLKSYNPDIYWSESLMDFGFLNSVLRADYFPPEDPWIQGQGVNYYYYGHYLAGFMTKLTGVEPHYGYNLFFITIPSVVALTIAAILVTLTRRIWVGLTGVVFAIVIGNLDGIPQALNIWVRNSRGSWSFTIADHMQTAVGWILNLGRQDAHFRFFRSAHELIRPTVHEFPFWSYNFMDLHAHTMATMLSTFFIAMQLVLLRHKKKGLDLFGENAVQRILTIGIMCVTYGAMISTNSWDVPTQFVLLILVSVWISSFANRKPKPLFAALPENDQESNIELPNEDQSILDRQYGSNDDIFEDSDVDPLDETQIDIMPEDLEMEPRDEDLSKDDPEDDSNADGETPDENDKPPVIVSASANDPEDSSLLFPDVNDNGSTSQPEKKPIPSETDSETKDETTDEPQVEAHDNHETESVPELPDSDEIVTDKPNNDVPVSQTDSQDQAETPEYPDETREILELLMQEDEDISEPVEKGPGIFSRMGVAIERFLTWCGWEIVDTGYFLWQLLWPVFAILTGALLLHMPYLNSFHRAGMGIGFLWKYKQTTNLDGYLTMFGFFLFIFITQLTVWWWKVQKERGNSTFSSAMILCSIVMILCLTWIGFYTTSEKPAEFSVLLINVYLMIITLWILLRGYPTTNQVFPLLLAFLACGIVAGCEIVFVRDFYHGSDMRRFNTIFKFYLQAWFMFAIVSAYLLSRRMQIRSISYKTGMKRLGSGLGRWCWNITFLVLLAGSFIFTFWGVYARHHHDEYRRVDLPLTLDGWAYMKQGYRPDIINEFRAINWLQENIEGTPVVLEASGADYLYRYGDVSGNTGLPTVLGWWSHIDQREYVIRKDRSKNHRDRKIDTGRIKRDIVNMYTSADLDEVLGLLGKYRVKYIFAGPTEKREYSSLALEKFAEMSQFMTPIYSNPDVIIYKVHNYGYGMDLTAFADGNEALKELKDRIAKREEQEKEERIRKEEAHKKRMKERAPRTLFNGMKGIARGCFEEPRSLAVAPDGSVFVGDFRNHRVQKFTSEGEWIQMWGQFGDQHGEFKDICDVAANSRFVYVLDTFNNRVQMFSNNGKFIKVIVPVAGSWSHPRGIVADEQNIYVTDTGNSRIVKLDNAGKFIASFGRVGKSPLQFSNPVGIDEYDGKLYIADVGNRRIQVITTDGVYVRSYPVTGWNAEVYNEPYVGVDGDGQIWYTDPTRQLVTVLSPEGQVIGAITKDHRGRPLGLPMGIQHMLDGTVLVVDARNHQVHVVKLKDGNQDEKKNQSRDKSRSMSGRSLAK